MSERDRGRKRSGIHDLLREVKVERPTEPPALPEPWPRDGRPSQPPCSWDRIVLEDAS